MTGKAVPAIVFVLIIAASTFAQTETTQTSEAFNLVFIDTTIFYDKEKGIREVIAAQEKLDAELKPQKDELAALAGKIQKIEEEFRRMTSSYAPRGITSEMLEAKIKEHETEIKKYKVKEKEVKDLYDKRKAEIFADIYQRVGNAIKQFAKEKNYALIVDISKMIPGTILSDPPLEDITEAFIKYYNENFVK